MTEIDVKGHWPARWQPLADTFARNFAEAGEEGAALAVMRDGELVASLWAGERNRAGDPWQEHTPVNVFSCGKALVAACVMALVDRGALDVYTPIGHYWPAFASRGKEAITPAQVLSHTSGLSAFHPRVKDPVIFDFEAVRSLIEYETPWWEPGQKQGYSPFLYGWILAELVRRVAGADSFPQAFEQLVGEPLGVGADFGVPRERQGELADVGPLKKPLGSAGTASPGASSAELGQLMKADPRGVTNRAFTNPMTLMNATNTPEWRSACIPAAGAHASASALARFYGALAGQPEWVGQGTLETFTRQHSASEDAVLGPYLRFGLGFMLSGERDDCRFGSARGFGHPGAGGSLGYADPERGLGVAYVTARMGQSLLIDARAQRLIATLNQLCDDE